MIDFSHTMNPEVFTLTGKNGLQIFGDLNAGLEKSVVDGDTTFTSGSMADVASFLGNFDAARKGHINLANR